MIRYLLRKNGEPHFSSHPSPRLRASFKELARLSTLLAVAQRQLITANAPRAPRIKAAPDRGFVITVGVGASVVSSDDELGQSEFNVAGRRNRRRRRRSSRYFSRVEGLLVGPASPYPSIILSCNRAT